MKDEDSDSEFSFSVQIINECVGVCLDFKSDSNDVVIGFLLETGDGSGNIDVDLLSVEFNLGISSSSKFENGG